MKLMIFIGLVAMAQALSDTTSTASRFCNNGACPGNSSVACGFTSNTTMRCNGIVIPLNQDLILSMHNRFRQDIASGEYSKFPEAANMTEMNWSDDLAQLALYNVKRCQFNHDSCRATPEFPYAGQNLGISKKTSKTMDFTAKTKNTITSWFNEYKDCDPSFITKYHSSQKVIGHFTQIVVDSSNYIGCAAVNYKKGAWNTFILACNYARTNIIGEPIYIAGDAGSQCKKISSTYSSLCSS